MDLLDAMHSIKSPDYHDLSLRNTLSMMPKILQHFAPNQLNKIIFTESMKSCCLYRNIKLLLLISFGLLLLIMSMSFVTMIMSFMVMPLMIMPLMIMPFMIMPLMIMSFVIMALMIVTLVIVIMIMASRH